MYGYFLISASGSDRLREQTVLQAVAKLLAIIAVDRNKGIARFVCFPFGRLQPMFLSGICQTKQRYNSGKPWP